MGWGDMVFIQQSLDVLPLTRLIYLVSHQAMDVKPYVEEAFDLAALVMHAPA